MNWMFLGQAPEGQNFQIQGVNVWSQKWIPVKKEYAYVKDPGYKQAFRFHVYTIHNNDAVIKFAAGEFSASIWGFYAMAERQVA